MAEEGIGLITKTYLNREVVNPITSGTMSAGNSITMFAATTSTADTAGIFTATIPGITEYYDGLTIKLKLSKSYNSTVNTLNINELGPKILLYRRGTVMTSHAPAYSEIMLTYRVDAHTGYTVTSAISASNTSLTSGTTIEDGWILETQYQDGNNYDRYVAAYERRYAGERLTRYQICGLDANGRVIPLTPIASGSYNTGSTKVCTTTLLNPYRFFAYSTTTVIAAGSLIGASALYESYPTTNTLYTFNENIPTYRNVYLVGNIENGLLKLDNSSTTSWYLFTPNTSTTWTLNTYFTSGKYYVFLGASYSSANYFQLSPHHEVYYFDGTNLLPYISKSENSTKVNGYNVQVVNSMPASPDANTIYILKS